MPWFAILDSRLRWREVIEKAGTESVIAEAKGLEPLQKTIFPDRDLSRSDRSSSCFSKPLPYASNISP